MYKICLVEDELDLANLIKNYLEKEQYEVITFSKGNDAIKYNKKVDLWILDIMLEDDITGYDIIKHIRSTNEYVPIIFTSARDNSIDKIMGLELGGDDYLAKPYSPKELVLRVNNLIKRVYTNDINKITYECYNIDLDRRIVSDNIGEVDLTTLEYDLFKYLLDNKGKTLSRDDILNNIWNDNYDVSDRAVDDLVRRLRRKLIHIKINTVYGYGYRLL